MEEEVSSSTKGGEHTNLSYRTKPSALKTHMQVLLYPLNKLRLEVYIYI